MVAFEVLLVVLVLVLQPLIALLWAYALYRAGVSFAAARSGAWVDNRVEKLKEGLAE